MDEAKFKIIFLEETSKHLKEMEAGVLELEKEPQDPPTLKELFRRFHSVKGMAASMGYEPIKDLCHDLESLLSEIINKNLTPESSVIELLLKSLDTLNLLIKNVESSTPFNLNIKPLLDIIQANIKSLKEEKSMSEPAIFNIKKDESVPTIDLSGLLKVDDSFFNSLMEISGDLLTDLHEIEDISKDIKMARLKHSIHKLSSNLKSLNDMVLTARMVPISNLTDSLPRIVRDICRKEGKKAELKVLGQTLSLDKAVLEEISDALLHIVRNSLSHGIEKEEVRTEKGKMTSGLLKIKAFALKEDVVIEITDDGKGMDRELIKAKALERGIINQHDAKVITDDEILMLTCKSGFSTAKEVSEISGRGVGMDAVKETVEKLGGTLSIESVKGEGTKITLIIPQKTSIIKSLEITASGEKFLIPLSRINFVQEVETAKIENKTYSHKGLMIPILPLSTALGLPEIEEKEHTTLVVVEHSQSAAFEDFSQSDQVALIVDNFKGETDAYVRPLEEPFTKVFGVSGITILNDGSPMLLLDINQIMTKADKLIHPY